MPFLLTEIYFSGEGIEANVDCKHIYDDRPAWRNAHRGNLRSALRVGLSRKLFDVFH